MTYYTVLPIDATRTAETTRTQAALKELCGKANITPDKSEDDDNMPNIITSWKVGFKDTSDMKAILRAVAGVLSVEQISAPKPQSNSLDRSRLVRPDDIKIYMVSTNTTDVQGLEDFLKSKIQGDTKFYQNTLAGKLLGWYNLALTMEGAEAIKAHKDIKGIRVEGKLELFRALPSPAESRNLIPRAGT